ncbi:putative ankyrin repeat protein RF_0381 isoform X2 [Bradysia coprophila]|uniref:putative ankyrin repeat protein RF_0381 isoform X2 n=1 Tax=Bradysia coprophila TaxID=38358 RepID=UPI00187DA3E2|nr:putative ankyrin repeat protein RF_0381 isoform X2 [Bradysia coprophila]
MDNFLLISLSVCLAFAINVHGDQETDSDFIQAALDDTPDLVKFLLKEGANINATDEDGKTALMKASNNGRYETVKFLIDNEADVNAKDTNGKTPLMFAAAFDNSKIVRLLVDNGANINATDNSGWSTLIYAAYDGRDRAVRALLRKGADADYALKYATEHLHSIIDYYNERSTSGVGGYQKSVDTINENNTFLRRLQSYVE